MKSERAEAGKAVQAYDGEVKAGPKVGGSTLTGDADGGETQQVAARGVAGVASALPFGDVIQRAFGRHDVSGVRAHTGEQAQGASREIGAEAYATGNDIAFAGAPSLHTAAHEAAHVVQQRGGVQLKGGVGAAGDAHEQHADAVADRVVAGGSAEGLLDRYAGGSSAGKAVQRQPAPQTPPPSAPVDTTITDTTRVDTVKMLRAEEIFADLPGNTDTKKHAFVRLQKAYSAETRATEAVAKTAAAEAKATAAEAKIKAAPVPPAPPAPPKGKHAKKPVDKVAAAAAATAKAHKAAEKAVADEKKASAEIDGATANIEALITASKTKHDAQLKDLKAQLEAAKAQKTKDAKAIAALEKGITDRKTEIASDVANRKHTDAGHTGESVYAPIDTEVKHHDYAFADGEHVKVRDHVVSYATSVSFGVDSEGAPDHKQVTDVMATAGLSSSRQKILAGISALEGGFDTVNTYDRAKVTWGFVQWTGGSHSDLTSTLTIIKQKQPDAFAKAFQAYGIDVVDNELSITVPGSKDTITGEDAANAIMGNPKLAAVLAHAGRNTDIQKGEVQAAAQLEIDEAMNMRVPIDLGKGKKKVVTASTLMTSEYGIGFLANTYVHSGSGAASSTVHSAVNAYVAATPYKDTEEWRAGAEEKILDALAARDHDRSVTLKKQLDTAAGSFT
ncbi:MAG TPA: DUF4157 domain-containing protein [Kofleriaceae bacterium]|jgi:hypothetical protein